MCFRDLPPHQVKGAQPELQREECDVGACTPAPGQRLGVGVADFDGGVTFGGDQERSQHRVQRYLVRHPCRPFRHILRQREALCQVADRFGVGRACGRAFTSALPAGQRVLGLARFAVMLREEFRLRLDGQIKMESLKAVMHATLKKLSEPPPPPPTPPALAVNGADAADAADAGSASATPSVYLLCDERDRKATVPLRRWLKDQGIDVALPAFEGGAAAVREANERQVAGCDAVLLFYGAGDEAWKRTTDSDLQKRRGLRGAGMPLLFTWLALPASPDKDDLVDMAEAGLIDGRPGFEATLLQPLCTALLARQAARRPVALA